jgi:protein tyrosine/serine phosphatase
MNKLVDFGIYRGPAPVTAEDWYYLNQLGIKYVLDLETGSHFFSDGSPLQETLTAEKFGIKVFAHPLGEIFPPTRQELSLALSVIDRFKPILIHCKKGVDRTGMVVAYYEKDRGFTKAQAISRMKSAGMHFWYYWWSWFL